MLFLLFMRACLNMLNNTGPGSEPWGTPQFREATEWDITCDTWEGSISISSHWPNRIVPLSWFLRNHVYTYWTNMQRRFRKNGKGCSRVQICLWSCGLSVFLVSHLLPYSPSAAEAAEAATPVAVAAAAERTAAAAVWVCPSLCPLQPRPLPSQVTPFSCFLCEQLAAGCLCVPEANSTNVWPVWSGVPTYEDDV